MLRLQTIVKSFAFFVLASASYIQAHHCPTYRQYEGGFADGLKISADYLYWQVLQDNMAYAAWIPGGFTSVPTIPAISIDKQLRLVEPKFNWDSGFRIGLDYTTQCSDWEFGFYWTRFHKNEKSRVCDSHNGIFPFADPIFGLIEILVTKPAGFSRAAFSNWRFQYDTLDFQVGRSCGICECLKVRPYVGVKAASILQKQKIHFSKVTTTSVRRIIPGIPVMARDKRINNFYGIGLSFGTDMMWTFAPHWNLSSGLSGAMLYSRSHFANKPIIISKPITGPITVEVDVVNKKARRLRPMLDAFVSLDWDTCFCENRVDISIGYEMQYWWNQWNTSNSLVDGLFSNAHGDLMLHGLTVHASISF